MYFLCATFSRSLDGGVTTHAGGRGGRGGRGAAPGGAPGVPGGAVTAAGRGGDRPLPSYRSRRRAATITTCGSTRRMRIAWWSPTMPACSISTTRGRSWLRVQLPIAQIYHVTVDNRVPYYVYGNKQDGPSYRGPSNSRTGRSDRAERVARRRGRRERLGDARSGRLEHRLVDGRPAPARAAASSFGSTSARAQGQNVEVWPLSTGGYAAADVKYRFVWDPPFTISPHDHNTDLYRQPVRAHDRRTVAARWRVISPDLTRNDKSKQGISGGLTPDDIGVEYGDVVYAIAESRVTAGADLGRDERRTRAADAQWRHDVDERDGEHSRHSAVGLGAPHRAVALRRRRGVHHRRRAPGEQSRSVGLSHEGLWQDVDS